MCSADHNGMFHTSQQCCCYDVCKRSLWSAEYIMNKSITECHRISNSIEIPLVRREPACTTLIYYIYLTLSLGLQPMALQPSMKAAHPLINILATASCRSSRSTGRWQIRVPNMDSSVTPSASAIIMATTNTQCHIRVLDWYTCHSNVIRQFENVLFDTKWQNDKEKSQRKHLHLTVFDSI